MRMQAADAVLFSQRLRWTRESFEELLGLDAFQDRKLELVRGEVVVKDLQKPPHANLIVKAPLYAQARVQEYWRIDLGKRVVEVFNGRRATHSKGTLAVPGFPAVTIQIEELFGS